MIFFCAQIWVYVVIATASISYAEQAFVPYILNMWVDGRERQSFKQYLPLSLYLSCREVETDGLCKSNVDGFLQAMRLNLWIFSLHL